MRLEGSKHHPFAHLISITKYQPFCVGKFMKES
nr:MAG TPA: hypothetical protein [Caudoviricetes sp.]